MLDLGRFTFIAISLPLLAFLVWAPRYPVFAVAVLAGIVKTIGGMTDNATAYLWMEVPTQALRMAACLEAFYRRTEDVTRRWTLFALCLSMASAVSIALTLVTVRESEIMEYNHARLAMNFGAAIFLGTLVAYISFFPLATAYIRDHVHVILLGLFMLLLGFSGAIRLSPDEAGDEKWDAVDPLIYWGGDILLLAWLISMGHLSVLKQLTQKPLRFGIRALKRINTAIHH